MERPDTHAGGFFHAEDLTVYDNYRLTTCVHSNWQLKALQNARLKAPLDVYLKVNSGMNRLGFYRKEFQRSGNSCGRCPTSAK
jgi:alanine racemase